MVAAVVAHLVGIETQQDHTGRQRTGLGHPAVELPANPLDHRPGGQSPCPEPHPLAALAVLALGGDDEARAHQSADSQLGGELVGQLLADEGERLQLLDGFVEDAFGASLLRRLGGRRRALVVTGRQAMGELARRPETVGDAGSGQLGDGAQCRETEAGEQAHQLGVDLARLVQPGDRLSGEKAR